MLQLFSGINTIPCSKKLKFAKEVTTCLLYFMILANAGTSQQSDVDFKLGEVESQYVTNIANMSAAMLNRATRLAVRLADEENKK